MNGHNQLKHQILCARDKRVELIESLLDEGVVLTLRANYPGDVKDNPITQKLISIMEQLINNSFKLKHKVSMNCGEGPVWVYTINEKDGFDIKRQSIEIEEKHPLGRLIDLDVYDQSLKSLSRKEMNVKSRTCYLCHLDAFVCIRNRNHTIDEITSYIKKVVESYEE